MVQIVNSYSPSARPYSLACFNADPSVIVGCELGGLDLVSVGETMHSVCRFLEDLTIDAVDVNQRNAVVYAHDEHVSIIHPSAVVQTRTPKSYSVNGFVSALKVSQFNPDVVAVGTTNGSIHVIDLRERMATDPKVYTNCHKRKVFKKDVTVSTTALNWLNEYTLVSGGAYNGECKFWDIRKPRKSALITTDLGKEYIKSIACSTSVYVLSTGIAQINAFGEQTAYFSSPDLVVESKYTELDVTPSGLAVGSSRGLAILNLTTEQWDFCVSDEVTSVRYHTHCGKVAAIAGNSVNMYAN